MLTAPVSLFILIVNFLKALSQFNESTTSSKKTPAQKLQRIRKAIVEIDEGKLLGY